MMNKRLFQETFAQLHASEHAKQEVLDQMEKQMEGMKRRPLRVAGLAAAIVAALCVTAGAVNAATDGALFETFSIVWTAKDTMLLKDEAGNQVTATLVDGAVEQVDGRLILKALGQEVDITDALEKDGYYRLEGESGGMAAAVEVTGNTESWTLSQTVEGGVTYSFTSDIPESGEAAGSFTTVHGVDGDAAAERSKSVSLEERGS